MIILVLGATGLLGNAMFGILSKNSPHKVFGTIRKIEDAQFFNVDYRKNLLVVSNLEEQQNLMTLFELVKPDVVVNCIALAKNAKQDPMTVMSMFALFPKRLAYLCRFYNARLIHISTDGIFNGTKGLYTEEDYPDTNDLYGIAKLLGEVNDFNTITIRTSIIGHELYSKNGLLEWFLAQNDTCRGFTFAIYSGFPSVVLAQIICDEILPRPELHGIYHIAAPPISKFDLLKLIAKRYDKAINIIPDDSIVVDRSLLANKFMRATGYVPSLWPQLVDRMYSESFLR
jgi:dTDP-4-dehydrorhamnose reductase